MAAVIVTGGAGFIGSSLVRFLVGNTGYTVVNLDKLTYAGNLDSLRMVENHPRYQFEKADICDGPALKQIFEKYSPSAIFHLAAESHVDRSIDSPGDFIRTNVEGTFTLLQTSLHHWSRMERASAEAFRFFTFPQMKFSGHWDLRACSRKLHRTIHIRHTRRAKLLPTTSHEPGTIPTNCQ
ncbi:MAG: dTDP-glucose 4,6-dehydratase [Verrucomicrobiales bacterium]|nr:dTDP-glucose 4,6-dehydratase [Verrucomicrobiales bacterium]